MAEPHPTPSDPRFQDLAGRIFGKLTVLFYAGKKSGKYSTWHCRCECGREQTIVTSQLTLGQTKSCTYCFRHAPKTKTRTDFEDLTGQVFDRLTVVKFDHRNKETNRTFWLCQCSCGESKVVRADWLKSRTAKSCGCLNISKAWVDQPVPETAACRKCKQTFPLTTANFYRHPKSKFGFRLICIPCVKEIRNRLSRKDAGKLRRAALVHYSGDPPHCQCPGGCDVTFMEFLSIDHIDGGGRQHRLEIKGGNIYRWLRKNNYPKGYRVLCMNCNFSFGKYGRCPHCKDT